jgi:hypothetical protein
VRFSYRCENLSCKHGESLILLLVFQIFVGAYTPTSYNVALPLTYAKGAFAFPRTASPIVPPSSTHPLSNIKKIPWCARWSLLVCCHGQGVQCSHNQPNMGPCPTSQLQCISSKWVYQNLYNSDGSLAWYKAHSVLCGFSKQPSVDYDETFNLVIKSVTNKAAIDLSTNSM